MNPAAPVVRRRCPAHVDNPIRLSRSKRPIAIHTTIDTVWLYVAPIIGGSNMGNEYYSARSGYVFTDLDLLTIGPIVQEIS